MKPRPARIGFKYATAIAVALMALLLWHAHAQYGGWGRGRRMRSRNPEEAKENELMEKAINPAFKEDVFTFARLKFGGPRGFGYGGGRTWDDDSPEADLNVIFRLYETTSLKVRPGLNFVDISTNDLRNYPFVYMAAAGRLDLDDAEAEVLRQYMVNGGFIMVDDFWGDDQWQHFYEQLKRIFPKREPVELALDHPIFRTVYKFKKKPQIPSVGAFMQYGVSYDPGFSYEKDHDPHYFAVYDDKQHMMMLICYNNHYGDGWEHEGDDHEYFDTFSQPLAYPMLFNILVYAMSH
jgi:Domain of unknown function (DUF4159)